MEIDKEKLVKKISETGFIDKFKENPKKTISEAVEESKKNPLTYDIWIYRMVIFALGFTLIFMACSLCIKMNKEEIDVPDVYISVISGILGALAGLLAPSPAKTDTK